MNGSPAATTHVTLISRRTLLRHLGTAGLLLALWPSGARATPEAVEQAIRQRIGEREPRPGGMTLTLPKIAETGNSVPLTVTGEAVRCDQPFGPSACWLPEGDVLLNKSPGKNGDLRVCGG